MARCCASWSSGRARTPGSPSKNADRRSILTGGCQEAGSSLSCMSTKELVLCELGETGIAGVESFSPFCLKAHRALKAAGLPYTRRHGSRPAAFRNYNRAEQVPVLLVDGEPVADSTEILRRIVALRPGALAAEPEAWLWEELADTALYGFVVAA